LGKNTIRITGDMDGLGAQADDIEFLARFMKGYPNTDYSKIGIAGYSWGGTANIIAAQKLKNVKAVLTLDGAISIMYSKLSQWTPYVNPEKMNMPFMSIAGVPQTAKELKERNRDTTFIFYETLNKADAYKIILNKMDNHVSFGASFSRLKDQFTQLSEPAKNGTIYSYGLMSQYALKFFDAYIKNNSESKKWLNKKPVENGIPSEDIDVEYKLKR
jgi:hypothetical protein